MVIPVRKTWPEATGSMGFVHLNVRIANHRDDTRFERVEMLADSGALYSVVPADLLHRIGVEPSHTEEFELADGRIIERRLGIAHVTVNGRQAAANVIFGAPGDSTLLGVVTLEELGFVIDPAKGELRRIHFRLGHLAPHATS